MPEANHGHTEGDVVLIHYQDKPAAYARIELIEPDVKNNWYQVTLLLLTIPSQTVTWILREEYINGVPFTMGGRPVRLGEVKRALPKDERKAEKGTTEGKTLEKSAKVIPLKRPS